MRRSILTLLLSPLTLPALAEEIGFKIETTMWPD